MGWPRGRIRFVRFAILQAGGVRRGNWRALGWTPLATVNFGEPVLGFSLHSDSSLYPDSSLYRDSSLHSDSYIVANCMSVRQIPVFIIHIPICPNMNTTREPTPENHDESTSEVCCTPVDHEFTRETIEADARCLAAMGNETRYEVLRLLEGSPGPVCACDLEPELAVDQSTTSKALKRLYREDLVDRRKDGRWRYYSLTDRARTLLGAIDQSRDE